MISPPQKTLRRRAHELNLSATRERDKDADTAALLLFYAAECGLKAIHMQRHNLKTTSDARGSVDCAEDYGHRIDKLINDLRIPKSIVSGAPSIMLVRTGDSAKVKHLHEAWRYGEKIKATETIFEWLSSIVKWVDDNV
jgi:hypothetical protein